MGIDTPPARPRAALAPAAVRRDGPPAITRQRPRPRNGAARRRSTARLQAGDGRRRREGGLTDDQILDSYGAYGLYSQGDTGAGVHVGVFEEEPFLRSDIEHFDTCFFGASAAAAMAGGCTRSTSNEGLEEGPGEGEAVLDVEDVSAAAPGAEIDVYDASEEVPEIEAIVQADRDQLITSSWGEICGQQSEEAFPERLQAINYLMQEGAAQGQTFLAASGDNGSDECAENTRAAQLPAGQNPVSTDPLADEPYVALGRRHDDHWTPASRSREHAWNNGGGNGAGTGGIAQDFVMPSWQREASVPGISDGDAGRSRLGSRQQRRAPLRLPPELLPVAAGRHRGDPVPSGARRLRTGRLVHGRDLDLFVRVRRRKGRGRKLLRRQDRLGDERGHILLDPPVGGDARARGRLPDVQQPERHQEGRRIRRP